MTAALTELKVGADTFQVRSLLPEDKAAVVEIDSIGWIKYTYDSWFEDSGNILTLCLADATQQDRLVAVEVAQLKDSGSTIWLGALRVHTEYRRRGLAVKLQRRLLALALETWPAAERVRYTTDSENIGSMSIGRSCGLDIVDLCGWLGIRTSEEMEGLALKFEALGGVPTGPLLLEGDDAVRALRSRAEPFPEKTLVLKWSAHDQKTGELASGLTARCWPGAVTAINSRGHECNMCLFFEARTVPCISAACAALAGELRAAAAKGTTQLFIHFPLQLTQLIKTHVGADRPVGVMLADAACQKVRAVIAEEVVGEVPDVLLKRKQAEEPTDRKKMKHGSA